MTPVKLLNAFSLNMINDHPASIETRRVTAQEVEAALSTTAWECAVGHESTASLFSSLLDTPVPARRVNVALSRGDRAFVGQYRGPRLEEGATQLPQGALIEDLAEAEKALRGADYSPFFWSSDLMGIRTR